MPEFLELELAQAADFLIRDALAVKKGESVLVTIDTETDFRVAEATARAAESAGGRVVVAWHSTPPGFGKVVDKYLPEPVKAGIPVADVWIEYNNQWLLYSTAWETAINNKHTRYMCLGGIDVERLVRCVGKVDWKLTGKFLNRITDMTRKAKKVRILNEAGTDVRFNMGGQPVVPETMQCWKPNPLGIHAHFLGGQIIWTPVESSINGRIVFDGSLAGGGEAYFGLLNDNVILDVKNGKIMNVSGGEESKVFKKWLASFKDDNMLKLAHVCYGFNPRAKLTGVTVEDERVWGCTEWGIGYQSIYYNGKPSPRDAPSHADGISLNCSVVLDGKKIIDNGRPIESGLARLSKQLGK